MNQKRKHIIIKQEKNTRRKFLKKMVYTAPSIIVLGELTKPLNAGSTASDTNDGAIW